MKPFKETKLGQFLSSKGLDHVLETVGTFVPGVAALDKIKDQVLGDPDKLNEEDKKEFLELYRLQLQELDMQLADVASARSREVEFVKATGHFDWMMWALAACGIGLLAYILWTLTHNTIPVENREMVASTKGTVEMIVVGIFSYYFGSSAGSRIKDMKK